MTSAMVRADPGTSMQDDRRSRRAVLAMFAVDGVGFGAWAAHLPAFKSGLRLSDGGLSVPLFAMVAGSLVAMPMAGRFIATRGSRGVAIASGCFYCSMIAMIALSVQVGGGLLWFTLAAFAFGAAKGTLDVSVNAQAVAVEREGSRPLLSNCHGCWSLGSLFGAGTAALALRWAVLPSLTMLVVGSLLMVVVLASAGNLRSGDRVESHSGAEASRRPSGRLVPLGVLAFLALFCEGAISDWSAVYLAGPVGVSTASAALGYTIYMMAMTLTRFAGDRLSARFGPAGLLRMGGLLVAVGLGGAIGFRTFPAALVGFGLVGMGLANAVPVIFRSAGKEKDPGGAIATVSTIGYLGFLAGPPMIGVLSEVLGLPNSLLMVVVFGLTIAVGAGIAGSRGISRNASVRRDPHRSAPAMAS
ncbi:MFS transporter [Tundrisphaera lichenicola]|uniref:MFS transporter n=1 Tax=Tundrisphaera lichenicola TaxID=2029860 RepID=UPI003EBC3638